MPLFWSANGKENNGKDDMENEIKEKFLKKHSQFKTHITSVCLTFALTFVCLFCTQKTGGMITTRGPVQKTSLHNLISKAKFKDI